MVSFCLPILPFLASAAAREIMFPSSSGFQTVFEHAEIDITTGSAFAGLTTYANLPYVHCLAGKNVEVEKYDIAILGAPFDTVSWSLLEGIYSPCVT
jgi:agmatinase